MTDDRAAKKAEEIVSEWRNRGTPVDERLARLVAAELRELYDQIDKYCDSLRVLGEQTDAEIARLRAEIALLNEQASESHDSMEELKAEIARLRDMNQKLWAALTPEKRHELNVSELAKVKP